MATVQMPDGALVELPDDADDALKERIRQKVESLKSQQSQPAAATPAPAPADVTPSEGKGGYVGRGEFAPRAGAESAPIVEQRTPERDVIENAIKAGGDIAASVPGMVAALPRYAYEGAKFAVGGPEEKAQVAGEALKEAIPMGQQIAQDVSAPLGTKESFRGLAQILMMGAPAVGEAAGAFRGIAKPPIQTTGLRAAFDPIFGKSEPVSPVPLSDAATTTAKEITDASRIRTHEGRIQEGGIEGQGGKAQGRADLEQPTPVEPGDAEGAPAPPVGGAAEQVNETLPLHERMFSDAQRQYREQTGSEMPPDVAERERNLIDYKISQIGKKQLPEQIAIPESKETEPLKEPKAPATPSGGAAEQVTPETITSVAIRNKETGQVTTGVNHTDAFLKVSPDALDADEWSGIKKPLTNSHEKGFVTSAGRFVSPKEGHAIQTGQAGELTHEDVIAPKLLPGELQGDLLSSTQTEPLKLVSEEVVDHEARALEEQARAEERAQSEQGQTTFEDLAQTLSKEDEAKLAKMKSEYESGVTRRSRSASATRWNRITRRR